MLAHSDLAHCATEPIRVPGAIQPHGWLLASDSATDRIVAYSDNFSSLTGLACGPSLTVVLQGVVAALRPGFGPLKPGESMATIGGVTLAGRTFDVTAHRAGSLHLIELEPASVPLGIQAPIHRLANRLVPLLRQATSLRDMAAFSAAEMKAITGFGRCLVYSFDAFGHGEVLAEQGEAAYDTYLGHHFPASDIPAQARDLYLLNRFRLIPNCDYTPSPLYVVDPSADARSVDLSLAQLRSVSPLHLEYMRNMGTVASMSVSIVVRGKLWGLISCHDHGPRLLDLQTRAACEHLGSLLSLQIEATEDRMEVGRRLESNQSTMQIVSRLGDTGATLGGLVDDPSALLAFARSTGAAVVFDNDCWTAGETPAVADLPALAAWIHRRGAPVDQIDDLVEAQCPVPNLAGTAGMLAISLSQVHVHVVVWFRHEILRSIRWAGEPPIATTDVGEVSPRRSFKTWTETVRGKSAPWSASEIAGALDLRQALIGIVLRRAQERSVAAAALGVVNLARDAAERADSAKTQFLAILSHELRTPLAAISSAADVLSRFAEVPERFSGLLPMIKRNVALEVRLIDDLLDLSAVSAGKLRLAFEDVNAHALIRQVVDMLKEEIDAKALRLDLGHDGMPVHLRADPVRLQQVLWNILRNAIKFSHRGGSIRLRCDSSTSELSLTCSDDGIGIDAEALLRIFNAFEQADGEISKRFGGLGLGLAIAIGVVRGHGGTLSANSAGRGHGATFRLLLPLRQNRI